MDSIKKRFVYKLSSNSISFLISFLLAGLVPRALGVENFGNYNFLIGIITQVLLFLELRTSYCFFTKVSQRPEEQNLQLFYNYCIYCIFAILAVVIFITIYTPLKRIFFLNQTNRYIFLASGVVFSIWLNATLGQRLDAFGKTLWLEKVQISFKIISAAILVALAFGKFLSLDNYFVFQYSTQGVLTISFVWYLRKKHGFLFVGKLPFCTVKNYIREFYQYCAPLFFYILIGLIYQSFDRWILQYYGGAYQQGLYSFSFTLSNMCALITAAMVPLLQREISIQAQKKDIPKMAVLFDRQAKPVYLMTAFLSAFIFVQADLIVQFFGGEKYANAGIILRIGSLYPLINSYGNLHSTIFFATSRTRTYLYLSIVITPFSMISAYVLLNTNHGFHMGGAGLALKEVVFGVISCLVYLVINARYLKTKIIGNLLHLLLVPPAFIGLSFFADYLLGSHLSKQSILPYLFIVGSSYSLMIAGVLALYPGLIGQNRAFLYQQITEVAKRCGDMFKR